ncbi:MAG: N-formylglutamate amidohydrolase [Sphingomonas bacterium]|nr:N-formylglutamate amidohydrolase [Sphingomonas bacterium]
MVRAQSRLPVGPPLPSLSAMDSDPHSTIDRLGGATPRSPVVLSVPHAGRDYPEALLANATVPRERLEGLEDRLVDALIGDAVAGGAAALIARPARCWLDLNRDEREIDPAMIDPPPLAHNVLQSAKLRGGLGLIPRRMAGARELWRAPLPAAELEARITGHHRPYHAAITAALDRARHRFGAALLMDCHSMPPINGQPFRSTPQVVIGDRFGRTAAPHLVDRLVDVAERAGFVTTRNAPYAGGHTLDRHGRPRRGVHAVQIEIDRTLYLDRDRRSLGAGAPAMIALFAAMALAMAEELGRDGEALAAE